MIIAVIRMKFGFRTHHNYLKMLPKTIYIGFKINKAMTMSTVVFGVVTPCSPVGLKMAGFSPEVAIRSAEILVTTYKTKRCHNPEDFCWLTIKI
jgi:hypothetical protein